MNSTSISGTNLRYLPTRIRVAAVSDYSLENASNKFEKLCNQLIDDGYYDDGIEFFTVDNEFNDKGVSICSTLFCYRAIFRKVDE